MAKRSELENLGIIVEEQIPQPPTPTEEDKILEQNMKDYLNIKEEPRPKPKPKDYGAAGIKILKVAIYIFSLQVLTYAAAVGAFYLFLQAVTEPTPWRFIVAMSFSVVVFLPTLYYSKNFR